MRELWRVLRERPDLRLLLGAGLVSLTGDRMLGIGLAYYVYVLTGSTVASAGMMLASFLPSVLLSAFAGVLVDRWDRKRTMVAANLAMAAGLLPLLLVGDAGHVWLVYVAAAWEGTVRLLFAPAEQAMVPRIVPDADLLVANALNGQVREVARLVGAAAGGVVVAVGGLPLLVALDAATFLASAALILLVRTSGAVERATVVDEAPPRLLRRLRAAGRRAVADLAEGLALARGRRPLQAVFAWMLIAMVGEGVMGALFPAFVRDVLGGGSEAYGLIASVQAVGGIGGGVVAAALSHRAPPALLFGVGALLFGFVDLVMFVHPIWYVAIWPAMLCMAVVGVPGAVTMAGYQTLLQRGTQDAWRGRVFGALLGVQGLGILVGSLAGGFLAQRYGVQRVIVVQGVGGMLAGVVVLVMLRGDLSGRHLRQSAV